MKALVMTVGAGLALYGFILILTSVTAVWGKICPECGYSRRGLPKDALRCPECGSAIDQETQGYIERKPGQMIIGLLAAIVGSGLFGVGMVLL